MRTKVSTKKKREDDSLSQARVESVQVDLINKGVPANRLQAIGDGESKPIATNETPAGREKNRRVEWVLLDQTAAR